MCYRLKEGKKEVEIINAKCFYIIIKSWEHNKLYLSSIYTVGNCAQVRAIAYFWQQHKISFIYFLVLSNLAPRYQVNFILSGWHKYSFSQIDLSTVFA